LEENKVNNLGQRHAALRWLVILALTGYAAGVAAEQVGTVAAADTPTGGDFETLRGFLESRGWRVERAADGSILLIPLGVTPEARKQAPAMQPELSAAGDLDHLRESLEARGWRLQRGAGDSLLLVPTARPAAEKPATTPQPASLNLTASAQDMQQLVRLLKACHWNLTPGSNNTLALLAPRSEGPCASAADAGCSGKRREFTPKAGVGLPVDTWRKAWQISANWLRESGYRQLAVGGIRPINWIYLVTVVDSTPPFRPRGELIINRRSGQLLASF
jgi:hypothetical protein